VALELVDVELTTAGRRDWAVKCGRFFRLASSAANRAAEAAYTLLKARNVPSVDQLDVPRSVVPAALRCVAATSNRDVRDWVVLAQSERIATFYLEILALVRARNAARRRNPAN